MPKADTVDRALRAIEKGYAEYTYFFEQLSSPAWLRPLEDRGRFRLPPPPIREGQYIRFPEWPESRYLVRMARIPEAQETVLRIALAIPASENSRVHDDLADIALSMQPSQSAALVPQICTAIPISVKLLLAEKVGELIVHLARGGQSQAALQLAGAALALGPDPRLTREASDKSLVSPEPQSHFRDWDYERIVSKAVPELIQYCGLEAVGLFCSLLDDAIRLSRKREEDGGEDYLYIWHPAIEQGKNPDHLPSFLLCAVRDATELLITAQPERFPEVIALLQDHKWVSFRRLEMHVARVFLGQGQTVAERVFQNPEILDQASLHHEAVLLLKAAFATLTTETQQHILSWIDTGPSEESLRRWLEFIGHEIADDNISNLANQRRLDHFSILEGQLPDPYQAKYDELKTQLGAPNPQDLVPNTEGGWISAQSPKTTGDLAQMSVAEVLNFLRNWVPGHDIFGPTAEGLGGAFAGVVSQRPADFAVLAEQMKDLDPTYIRSLLGSLTATLKRGEAWDWGPVLELARWVVAQGREIPGRNGGLMDADPDWGWSRTAVIDLLSAGFKGGPERLPLVNRTVAWEVLRPLTDDPNPGLEAERGEKFDPSFLSINSTRGRALDAVVDYAWWLRRCTDAERQAERQMPVTFELMPEVREILDEHLDIEKEPTLTIRSVYGRHLSSFAGLDWDWLRSNVDRILPVGEADPPRFNAAWDSFIRFNQPNTVLLSVLMTAYQRAVQQTATPPLTKRNAVSPEDRLAQHLMVYYWVGKLKFDAEDRLLDDFYSLAPDALRGHAMWFVGTSISKWDDAAPVEVFDRLRDLLQRRLQASREAASPEAFMKELANFGYWFISEKFEERWSMDTLLAILQLTKKTESEMDVVKLLAERCPRYPVECVACLRLMVEGDRERWLLLGVEDDVKRLLRSAIDSNNTEASLSARRLTEHLIARGHFGFRTVLK
jgi:hypothetical protein